MAKKNKYVVGLDVGTTKTCAIICELNDKQQIVIVGMGSSESKNVKKILRIFDDVIKYAN